jgi:cyclopropane-fatty-acyl-phospholipid synthase
MSIAAKVSPEPAVVGSLRRWFADRHVPPFELHLPDKRSYALGLPGAPAFRVWLRNERAVRALATRDEVTIGTAYLDGDIDVQGDFLAVLDLRTVLSDRHPLERLWRFVQPLLLGQVKSNQRWVPQHYDHGNDLYFTFLDKEHRLYSQALYTREDETLEQAAENKLAYIADVCRLEPGSHVLDVGGGWGSFGRFAAARGIDVTMLTISHEQFAFLSELSGGHLLPGTLRAVHDDVFSYAPGERYDAIVLLGVMEHLPDYRRLFRKFEELLRWDGRLYMDFSANRTKFKVSTFTSRYVFPGNHTPVVVPDLLASANETSFEPIALHNDRHSYFLTLRSWARNLEAARSELVDRFGERTFRLFQLYLWAGAHQLHRDGRMESYRVAFQRSHGHCSGEIGTYQPL